MGVYGGEVAGGAETELVLDDVFARGDAEGDVLLAPFAEQFEVVDWVGTEGTRGVLVVGVFSHRPTGDVLDVLPVLLVDRCPILLSAQG